MCKHWQITHKLSKAQRVYVKFVSDLTKTLHIDKILIIPTLSSKAYFADIIAHFRSWRKENSSEILAHGI